MMKDGFERTLPKPIHLEATTAKSRDIYARYGFEVYAVRSTLRQTHLTEGVMQIDEEHCFGRGTVDSNGLTAYKNERTGYPEWIMTKVGDCVLCRVSNTLIRHYQWTYE